MTPPAARTIKLRIIARRTSLAAQGEMGAAKLAGD
jgi:hypothetical protein